AERDRALANRVDVALLVDALGCDTQAAVAPDDILEHARGRFVSIERPGDRGDRAGPDLVPALDQVGELTHDALAHAGLVLGPVECDQVAAQEHLAVEVLLERAQHGVLAAGQLGRDFVRQLELGPHPASEARTSSDTRLPSARPSTAPIAWRIATPMSFGDCAPLSVTARSTISRSSASDSSAGRYAAIRPASASSPPARSSRPASP